MLATVVGGHAVAFSVIVVVVIAFPHFPRWHIADGHRCLVTFVPTGVGGSR